jgi:hypothetical protein
MEIHIHRMPDGTARKAHIKLTGHEMVAGTSQDNDIPVVSLPTHGISTTDH